jgi:hypothetical protein
MALQKPKKLTSYMIKLRIVSALIVLLMNFIQSNAQTNLVKNPSFEEHFNCDYSLLFHQRCVDWHSIQPVTADYFNECDSSVGFWGPRGVPLNSFGFQYAKDGQAYTGIAGFYNNSWQFEYIQGRLIDTLKQGHRYYFSSYINRAEKSFLSSSALGVYFSEDSISMGISYVHSQPYMLNVQPQIKNPISNYFLSYEDWELFEGEFMAVGNEQYITIGFFANSIEELDTTSENYFPGGIFNGVLFGPVNMIYYYIDDVSLIDLDSALSVEEFNLQRRFSMFPNPAQHSVQLASTYAIQRICIFDINGKLWLNEDINALLNHEINTSQLNNGVYVVELLFGDGMLSRQRFVVMR